MSAETQKEAETDGGKIPVFTLAPAEKSIDWATIIGASSAILMIAIAIWMGHSDANFINAPSFFIVVLGTIAATSISFTTQELAKAGSVLRNSIVRTLYNPSALAISLLTLAVVAKKKGILILANYDGELRKDPFLHRAAQLTMDGYQPDDIERLLSQEIMAVHERHKRAASIVRRAAEIAPAMGLIGTVIGLVQMLADLENPEVIGPAMAVALITTFYGVIMGSVLLGPLAVKLEKNSNDEILARSMIMTTAASIARQENPRRLEMLLNAELPPSDQVLYFD